MSVFRDAVGECRALIPLPITECHHSKVNDVHPDDSGSPDAQNPFMRHSVVSRRELAPFCLLPLDNFSWTIYNFQ